MIRTGALAAASIKIFLMAPVIEAFASKRKGTDMPTATQVPYLQLRDLRVSSGSVKTLHGINLHWHAGKTTRLRCKTPLLAEHKIAEVR